MIRSGLLSKLLEVNYFCEVTIPICSDRHFSIKTVQEEADRILSDKPDLIKNNDYIDNLYKEIAADKLAGKDRETMTMYHFSDLHFDYQYTPGKTNTCNDIVCCRSTSGDPQTPDQAAGKWGDYRCDANPKLFEQVKYTFNMTGSPDFIVWTGDNIQHTVDENPEDTSNNTVLISEFVQKYSPSSVVFPIHGNHEFNPMNSQNFSKSLDPVVDRISESWRPWLTNKTYEEYRKNTYFSYDATTHPNVNEDFNRKMNKTRIIAINSNN